MLRFWHSVGVLSSTVAVVGLAAVLTRAADPPPSAKIDFAKDIQPILADNCYKCHGAEKHKADLRLDVKSSALEGGTGGKAIVPGKSAESLIIKHLMGEKDFRRMPPEPADPLKPEQIALIKSWIDAGADWPEAADASKDPRLDHWSYQPPKRSDAPQVSKPDWCRNPIDRFVLAKLDHEKLSPSHEADKETLIRRVTLDLTGLPPTLEEIDAFLKDTSAQAYERVVDRLLASPRYGERWALWWLDAARYADTNGYEKDRPRSMWRYRDYVIDSFNSDKPFDQFTIEQLAGDMLPGATESQIIASAFNRNTMINEEGGIDTEEYRFRSIVDRVQTTGTVFLGMTVQCCQCHNHKYDPISQKDYYRFFALLNNQDEPILETPTTAEKEARAKIESQIDGIESRYEQEYPLPADQLTWTVLDPAEAKAIGGATLKKMEDRSLLASGPLPETDTYTVSAVTDARRIATIRLEALTDSSLPKAGPGRADNGNFVLTSLTLTASPKDKPADAKSVTLWNASADFTQPGFSIAAVLDDNPKTGWAIDTAPTEPRAGHTANFELKMPVDIDGGARLTFTLGQNYGGHHAIGRFRLLAGSLPVSGPMPAPPQGRKRVAAKRKPAKPAPVAVLPGSAESQVAAMRADRLRVDQAAWVARMEPSATDWRVLHPTHFSSEKKCTMNRLEDDSILVTGDRPTRDVYLVDYDTDLTGITAIRLEAIADPRLPFHGPGRGGAVSDGNFMLNEMELTASPVDSKTPMPDGQAPHAVLAAAQMGEGSVALAFKGASADYYGNYGGNQHKPENAIDGNLDSGWSVAGAIGKTHWAVFELKEPAGFSRGTHLRFKLSQCFIDQHTLGRFRISVTRKTGGVQASSMPPEIEAIVAQPREWWNDAQREQIKDYFLSISPALQAQHDQIAALRASEPPITTTLVMEERVQDPRPTNVHLRGNWDQLGEPVTPGVPSALPQLPTDQPASRLTLAKWMVSGQNPLTGRVLVNRLWREYFGRGIVETVDDFGMRTDAPSHPELLDWLATEVVQQKWSIKAMHRLIVTSATYRQSSVVTSPMIERDPYNVLLARGPRFRVNGEVVRDLTLSAAGLLVDHLGGPSVYPPQPEGVTSLVYGGAGWPTSTGANRYRRGLYTYWKRANPYPSIMVFDAPVRDTCVVKRVRSNTPLQALTLLNDPVYIDAAQAFARRVVESGPADAREKIVYAFRLCTGRQPTPAEVVRIEALLHQQLDHFVEGKVDAAAVSLPDPKAPPAKLDLKQLAAWTMVANVLLNLDETITKG